MLFTSWTFAVFLPLVFLLHYAGRSVVWQAGVLTVASFVFYGWHTPSLVILLAASTTINAEAARMLIDPRAGVTRRRVVLGLAVAANLGALCFFKYAALIGGLVLPAPLWARWGPMLKSIPLPVGISFYTFQGLSLVIDAWRAGPAGIAGLEPPRTAREWGWFQLKVWFFKAFFPQLVAGPIVKAGEFLYQIGAKRMGAIEWDVVVKRLIAGFFLKMVVADNLREATAALRAPLFELLPKVNLIALLYGFSIQIYADFCGYSLMAMGLAKLFGYELPINFAHPYLARSMTEFWRRWHLSLSSWLREYLYIPLGGNRLGSGRTYVNLFIVMFLGGLWHGAAWSYAIWGTAHGLLLAMERFVGRRGGGGEAGWTAAGVLRAFLTFNVVSALWLLFKLPEFHDVIAYARCLVRNPWGMQPQAVFVIALFSIPVVAEHLMAALERRVEGQTEAGASTARWGAWESAGYALMLFLVLVNSGTPGEFIYFQF